MTTLVHGMLTASLRYPSPKSNCDGRHFVKEDLPRIQYANPAVSIQVNKQARTKIDSWKPEMIVETSAYPCSFTAP